MNKQLRLKLSIGFAEDWLRRLSGKQKEAIRHAVKEAMIAYVRGAEKEREHGKR
jgi:hypothetical protein